jgi:hypothetical protein
LIVAADYWLFVFFLESSNCDTPIKNTTPASAPMMAAVYCVKLLPPSIELTNHPRKPVKAPQSIKHMAIALYLQAIKNFWPIEAIDIFKSALIARAWLVYA